MPTTKLILGDCIEKMKELPANSVDVVITDPPYGLAFMGKEWDKIESPKHFQEFTLLWAMETLRVLKPGGFLFSMGGTRTYHRMTCGIEDAGFQIRDCLAWCYLQGFPKAQSLSGLIDAKMGIARAERPIVGHQKLNPRDKKVYLPNDGWGVAAGDSTFEGTDKPHDQTIRGAVSDEAKEWEGWKTPGLKPAFEPIVVAQKLCDGSITENVMKYGVGGYNIDASRVPLEEDYEIKETQRTGKRGEGDGVFGEKSCGLNNEKMNLASASPLGRYPANVIMEDPVFDCDDVIKENKQPNVGHVPKQKGDLKDYVYAGGWKGGKQEEKFYNEGGGFSKFFIIPKAATLEKNIGLKKLPDSLMARSGGAQQAEKEGKEEYLQEHIGLNRIHKVKNFHPTVKPVSLMSWLIKLTTKQDAVVLDPFMGSGTTGIAAYQLCRNFIGIEKDEKYFELAKVRIAHETAQKKLDFL